MDNNSNQNEKSNNEQELANAIKRYIKFVVGNENITTYEFKQIEKLPNLHEIVNYFENNNRENFYIIIDLFKNTKEWIDIENVRKLQLTVDYLDNHKMGKRLCPFGENPKNSFETALQYFHSQK